MCVSCVICIYIRTQTGRGTSAAATGRSSWMQASRLNTIEHCPFAHFEKAKSIGHPHARERAGRELPPDIERAIKFALSHGAHKMERPQHVRIVTRHTNIAMLCMISDTVHCDYALGKDFLYGFQMTGHVPDSGVHRLIERMSEQLLTAQTEKVQESSYEDLLAIQLSVDQQGPSSDPQRRENSRKKPTNRSHWAG